LPGLAEHGMDGGSAASLYYTQNEKKYASLPPVILLVTTFAVPALDSYSIYWQHHNNTLYRYYVD